MLVLAGILYVFAAYMSYSEGMRREWWYVPLAVFVGTIASTIWFWTVRYIDDKDRIYVYTMFWDFVLCAVYFVVPLLWFGVKLDRWQLCGLLLMIIGLAVIKLRS